ncbi:phosphatase 2C [Musa troglodytarum]|uniref:Phosphatase 2C n=1 Tax=Musa troglodytarum TaxID=320322 RepID=A0A9E7L1Y6_9LILI|nr:phosphatase 2C [Musa troglodytarum]URE40974.1 phosphatase 2C [Musa troglodytarum]URE40978.1 phosphatase 2C [Musa troglodytarum]
MTARVLTMPWGPMKSPDGTRVGKCLRLTRSRRVRFTKQVRTTTNRFLIGESAGPELLDHLFVGRASATKQLIHESRDTPVETQHLSPVAHLLPSHLSPGIFPEGRGSFHSHHFPLLHLVLRRPRVRIPPASRKDIKSFHLRNFACCVLWNALSKGVGWMLLSRSLAHGRQSRETREPSRPQPIRERRGRGGRG